MAPSPASFIHISNALTYLSLLMGVGAIAAALSGSADAAGALIAAAAIADTFDGWFARRFTRSPELASMGVQLDSLADAVTFGIAPVVVAGVLFRPSGGAGEWIWWGSAFVYAACALTRLGFYNVWQGEMSGFVGLPTPVAALFWSTLASSQRQPRRLDRRRVDHVNRDDRAAANPAAHWVRSGRVRALARGSDSDSRVALVVTGATGVFTISPTPSNENDRGFLGLECDGADGMRNDRAVLSCRKRTDDQVARDPRARADPQYPRQFSSCWNERDEKRRRLGWLPDQAGDLPQVVPEVIDVVAHEIVEGHCADWLTLATTRSGRGCAACAARDFVSSGAASITCAMWRL